MITHNVNTYKATMGPYDKGRRCQQAFRLHARRSTMPSCPARSPPLQPSARAKWASSTSKPGISQKHLRLWVHEVTRVIGDRLGDNSDRLWMLEHMRNVMKTNFNASFDDVMKHLDSDCDGKVNTLGEARNMIFGDMLSQPAAPNRPYQECMDIPGLQKMVESHLEQYKQRRPGPGTGREAQLHAHHVVPWRQSDRGQRRPGPGTGRGAQLHAHHVVPWRQSDRKRHAAEPEVVT